MVSNLFTYKKDKISKTNYINIMFKLTMDFNRQCNSEKKFMQNLKFKFLTDTCLVQFNLWVSISIKLKEKIIIYCMSHASVLLLMC